MTCSTGSTRSPSRAGPPPPWPYSLPREPCLPPPPCAREPHGFTGLGFPALRKGEPLMTGPVLTAGAVPVGPMLSMFDPIFVGINDFGLPHYTRVIYKNLLAAGEPGGGKSGLLNTLAAHAALSARSRTVLFDAKQVELGMWDDMAD